GRTLGYVLVVRPVITGTSVASCRTPHRSGRVEQETHLVTPPRSTSQVPIIGFSALLQLVEWYQVRLRRDQQGGSSCVDPQPLSVTVSEGTTFSAMWGPSWNLWVSMKRSTFESPLIFSRESALRDASAIRTFPQPTWRPHLLRSELQFGNLGEVQRVARRQLLDLGSRPQHPISLDH